MSFTFISDIVNASHDLTVGLLTGFGLHAQLAEIAFIALWASTLFNIVALYAMFGGQLERKLIARTHSRIGPMYTGPYGLLQTAADALKFLKKEIIFPRGSDRKLFVLAPIIMTLTAFLSLVFVPIGSFVLIQSEYSLLFVLALLSFTPIAILVGSWASNSKYSTLGGLRSAAMTMAYEVLLAVAVASIILTTHSFSIVGIVQWQQQHGIWLAFAQPVAFILFLIAAVASVERNPFDIPEAESELVSGWRTEYGGVYFSLTLLAEYVKLFVTLVLTACLFFGGWMDFGGDIGFLLKLLVLTMFMMYIRATALRMRIDQLFTAAWGRLVPLAFLNFIATVGILAMLGGA
jgi:NADH-quinone oxidoreductase subunit H